jgi:hypothetical protein
MGTLASSAGRWRFSQDQASREVFEFSSEGEAMSEPSTNNGDGQKFVDLVVHNDYVILSGTKLERTKVYKGTPQDWVLMWEGYKKRLATRGSMKNVNVKNNEHFTSDMDKFRAMIERG